MPSDMQILELTLNSPAGNLAGDEALLERCEARGGPGILRFWESPIPFVVLGYANKVDEEVEPAACRELAIPILRRCSGGGAVVQGPGCLNYSLVLPIAAAGLEAGITATNRFVMQRNARALSRALGRSVQVSGHTDLAIDDRKFSGNAQRRKREWFLFHGTFLIDFDLELIQKVLRPPPRQPDYRRDRSHAAFITNLPVTREAIRSALISEWMADELADEISSEAIERLIRGRYARDEWNLKW
jgi:lipoate---protein ligase